MITFTKRPLPLNSFRSIWKTRNVDQLYSELHYPGYGKNLADIEKIKTFFALYYNSIINRDATKLKDYMEPRYYNDLSAYLRTTAGYLDIKLKSNATEELSNMDVEFT